MKPGGLVGKLGASLEGGIIDCDHVVPSGSHFSDNVIALIAVAILEIEDAPAIGRPLEAEDRTRRVGIDDAHLPVADRAGKDSSAACVRGYPPEALAVR